MVPAKLEDLVSQGRPQGHEEPHEPSQGIVYGLDSRLNLVLDV
jgi:hypothetical protein